MHFSLALKSCTTISRKRPYNLFGNWNFSFEIQSTTLPSAHCSIARINSSRTVPYCICKQSETPRFRAKSEFDIAGLLFAAERSTRSMFYAQEPRQSNSPLFPIDAGPKVVQNIRQEHRRGPLLHS